MEQHPIPQQISSYQFRLVGDMTLKQFFQLAGGFLVALIFYSAPLIGIIKWPFVIVSAILGIALAFLPLEERPLEKWIFAFFRAIYAPTEFFWKKTVSLPKFYQDEPTVAAPVGPQAQALNQYLSATAQKNASTSKLEGAEAGFLAALTGIVSNIVTQATGGPIDLNKQISKSTNMQIGTTPSAPQMGTGQAQPAPVKNIPIYVVEEKAAQGAQITTHQVSPIIAGEEIVSTREAIFSPEAAPPIPPTMPNVVVGQVVDNDRRIIEGAIMEIRDSAGHPIRAIRSNKVGHFITVTPLEVGNYDIITEKEGYQFIPVSFEAKGEIIPPIMIEGRKITNQEAGIMNQEPTTTGQIYGNKQ